MKTLLSLTFLGLITAACFGANPAFQSFDTNDFTVTPSLNNPKVIHSNRTGVTNIFNNSVIINTNVTYTNIYTTNFIDNSVIIITNTTITINGTNIATINPTDNYVPYRIDSQSFGDSSLEQQSPFTLYAHDQLFGDQIRANTKLETSGEFSTGSSGLTLIDFSTNNVDLAGKSVLNMVGAATPSTSFVLLAGPTGLAGQHVWLVNGTTNGGFTLLDADCYDIPAYHTFIRGGSWVPTHDKETIELMASAWGWIEIGRSDPTSTAPGTINPTDGYMPIRSNATTFADSPLHYYGATNDLKSDGYIIQPFDVRWYGAKGDGVTDDTKAIQDAIDAASNNTITNIVYLPPGVYYTSGSLFITNPIAFIGANMTGKFDDTGATVGSEIMTSSFTSALNCTTPRVYLSNIRFTSTNNTPYGVKIKGEENYIYNLNIGTGPGQGFQIGLYGDNASITTIRDCIFSCNTVAGMYLDAQTSACSSMELDRLHFYRSPIGLKLGVNSDINLHGSWFESCQSGIYADNSSPFNMTLQNISIHENHYLNNPAIAPNYPQGRFLTITNSQGTNSMEIRGLHIQNNHVLNLSSFYDIVGYFGAVTPTCGGIQIVQNNFWGSGVAAFFTDSGEFAPVMANNIVTAADTAVLPGENPVAPFALQGSIASLMVGEVDKQNIIKLVSGFKNGRSAYVQVGTNLNDLSAELTFSRYLSATNRILSLNTFADTLKQHGIFEVYDTSDVVGLRLVANSGGVNYIQPGQSSTDTNAVLRFSLHDTGFGNFKNADIYADKTFFNGYATALSYLQVFGDTGPTWNGGTGSPEGAVTAPVGSLFSRLDGATNTAVYYKGTGTGNTGWLTLSSGGGGSGTINPTDLYVPYRSNSTTFADSLLSYKNSTNMQIYANTASEVSLVVSNTAGLGMFGVDTSGNAFVGTAGGGNSVDIFNSVFTVDISPWSNNTWRLGQRHSTSGYWSDVISAGFTAVGYDSASSTTNYSYGTWTHSGTNGYNLFRSLGSGIAGAARPHRFADASILVEKNIGAESTVGDATWVDMNVASQTNVVSGAVTISYATNGVAGAFLTHVRVFYNGSGSDQTLTIPSGWKTNFFSAVPSKITNGIETWMYVKSKSDTGSSALQTNVNVSFEFYK